MEDEHVDNVYDLKVNRRSDDLGGSSRGDGSNGCIGSFDLNQDGEPEWVTVYNHPDHITLEVGQDAIEITPIQVEALHSLLGVILRERDNVQ